MFNIFSNCTNLNSVHTTDIETLCRINFQHLGKSGYYNSFANPLTYAHHLYIGEDEVREIVIPNSVRGIGEDTFNGCGGLISVTILNSNTYISDGAFADCSELASVTLPADLYELGRSAFIGCSELVNIKVRVTDFSSFCNHNILSTINASIGKPVQLIDTVGAEIRELIIPESVTSIGNDAFINCNRLLSVTIPSNVTSIKKHAFSGCTSLTSIKSYIDKPFAIDKFPDNTYRECVLYVPKGTKDLYIRYDGWREFLNIEEMGDEPAPNGQCATPTIIVSGNRMTFECETPDAEFTSYLTTSEEFSGDEVVIENKDITFTLTVYAIAPGYDRSKPATMKFTVKKSDVNGDGHIDVADIATIISEMAAQARVARDE